MSPCGGVGGGGGGDEVESGELPTGLSVYSVPFSPGTRCSSSRPNGVFFFDSSYSVHASHNNTPSLFPYTLYYLQFGDISVACLCAFYFCFLFS